MLPATGSAQDKPDPGAADLKRVMSELREAMKEGNDPKVAGLAGRLLPDEARLDKGLGAGAGAEGRQKVLAFFAKLPRDEASLARLFNAKPEQTEVSVHGATTEEMAEYKENTPAYNEFPGPVKALASKGALIPGKTYYEVEFTEPGKDAGMKFHLFYWDGASWAMLGPLWRMLGQ